MFAWFICIFFELSVLIIIFKFDKVRLSFGNENREFTQWGAVVKNKASFFSALRFTFHCSIGLQRRLLSELALTMFFLGKWQMPGNAFHLH